VLDCLFPSLLIILVISPVLRLIDLFNFILLSVSFIVNVHSFIYLPSQTPVYQLRWISKEDIKEANVFTVFKWSLTTVHTAAVIAVGTVDQYWSLIHTCSFCQQCHSTLHSVLCARQKIKLANEKSLIWIRSVLFPLHSPSLTRTSLR
jgi:hypothetical protein